MSDDERADERQEECEFLQGLKARTGRDLAEWMAAIAAQGFSDKNEIIDWLRTEGLPFARASWLERIHRNGGKPIHADASSAAAAGHARVDERPKETRQPRPRAAQPVAQPPAGAAAAIEELVAAAKGYRPLFLLLESELRKAIPGLAITPRSGLAAIGAPAEFAAVSFHATELRLGLALGQRPFDGRLQKAKLKGAGPAITHMVVLTDARQVNEDLLALARATNRQVNG